MKTNLQTTALSESASKHCQILDTLDASVYAAMVINKTALALNYQSLQKTVSTATNCTAVVKANAYGVGLHEVSQTLAQEGCTVFWVAYTDEGIELRTYFQKLGLSKSIQIYVLNGYYPGCEPLYLEHNLIPIITDIAHLQAWKKFAHKVDQRLPMGLHVDTGLARTGIPLSEQKALFCDRTAFEGMHIQILMSHLACADTPDHPMNEYQRQRFDGIRKHFPNTPSSLASSPGIFLNSAYHYEIVRPGMALYGLNSSPAQPHPLHCVVSVWARLYQLQTIQAGKTVGYGAVYKPKNTRTIATFSAGYADGIPWQLSQQESPKQNIQIGCFKAPLIGRLSMDLISVDVTDLPESLLFPGQWCQILGEQIPAEEVAAVAQTNKRDILLKLGPRLKRVYTDL